MTPTSFLSRTTHSISRLLPMSLAKRLMLLPLLGANAAFAQYCEIDFDNVEAITRVQFADIDNAVAGESAYENFTHLSSVVFPGQPYEFVVEGNTDGPFDNWISVYIDWNQDGEFDPDDELYELEDALSSSTGSDGKQVSGEIMVPEAVQPGTIRMRVVKNYGSYGDACGEMSFGQAEDYSLTVSEPSETAPVVTQAIPGQNLQVYEDFTLDLTAHFEDRSDANTLAFTATGLPTGITLNADSGLFSGSVAGIGAYSIWVRATNPGGEYVSATFTINVIPEHEGFSGGNGSAGNPWKVATAAQLYALRHNTNDYFELVADIALDTAPWNVDGGWLPIGDADNSFTGVLRGNGHRITGLTINRPNLEYVGLFGLLWYASIDDVHLEDVSIRGEKYVGALGGSITGADVSNVSASGSVTGDMYVGGLSGSLGWQTEVSESSFSGTVTGGAFATGGLVGGMSQSEIVDSHAHVDVVAGQYAGGLVGNGGNTSTIRRSHAVGTVSSDSSLVGGLLGLLTYGGTLQDSYAQVDVSGSYYVGGLLGGAWGSSVSNSYAVGSVTGSGKGALVGYAVTYGDDYAAISDAFWNKDLVGGLNAIGIRENNDGGVTQVDNVVGLTQAQMQDDALFVAAGWNFSSVWAMAPGGYPYHVLFAAEGGGNDGGGDDEGDEGSTVSFAGGDGSLADPWQVSSAEQLNELRNFPDDHFVLTADIDLGTAPWNAGAGWLPIGGDGNEFRGSLDGNGYTITGLTIDRPTMQFVGLFGQAWFAAITDVRLEDVNVTGGDFTGALAGMAGSTEISGAFVSGNITSAQGERDYVGGLVGYAGYDTLINNSDTDVAVVGVDHAGGLIGAVSDAVVNDSYATGSVEGAYAVGGLVGGIESGVQINDSHAHVAVSGEVRVGGLVGSVYGYSVMRRSHAVGSVTGSGWLAGGLVGLLSYGAQLHDSYAHSSVSGVDNVGGLIGDVWGAKVMNSYAVGTVSGFPRGGLVGSVYSPEGLASELINSYWNAELTGGMNAYGENENDGASSIFTGLAGYSQTELRDIASFSGWNFSTVWDIGPGLYPFHRNIGPETDSSTAPAIAPYNALVNGSVSLDVSDAFHNPGHALVSYSATGLPPGVTINDDGLISGTPTAGGSYAVSIVATYDGTGPRTGSVVIHVLVFAGGAGTSVDPWQVATAAQLDKVRNYLDGHFVLVSDIDLGGAGGAFANAGAGWEPIGGDTLGDPFTGTFDGGGHLIRGLYINRPDVDHAGLFGTIDDAEIRNVGLIDVDVTGYYATGALVGYQVGGVVSTSFVTGTVKGESVGGLVGISEGGGVIENSYSRAKVTSLVVGGGGGLVGVLYMSDLGSSYASGSLGGPGLNGALVGMNVLGQLGSSFWNSDIAGSIGIGCHYDDEGCGADPDSIAGLSSAQLRQQATFSDWDFVATWGQHASVNDGYPYLLWQDVVIVENGVPVVATSIGERSATQGAAFSLDVSSYFIDPDDDELTFSATGLPASLGISAAGVISGTPTNADALSSPYTVTVTASDGELATSDSFTLTVANVNDAPYVISTIGNQGATQGSEFSLDVSQHFGDPDGDELTFSATGLPATFGITSVGVISGTPTNADALNSPYTVIVTATDGTLTAEDSFTLTIANVNDAPLVVSAIGDQGATQGSAFSVDISAHFSDPDGDELEFNAGGLPSSISISGAGVISGTPTNADALNSPYTVTVTATDGTATVDASFTLTIVNVNDAPVVVSAIGNRSGTQDIPLSLDLAASFSDPDGDELTFGAAGLPASLAISEAGVISGTPTNADALNSPYTVTITATDGTLTADESFTLTIANVNDAPAVVAAIGNRSATQDSPFSLDASGHFSDVDDDELTFSATGLPASLGISEEGIINGTPTNADVANSPYTVTVTASDGTLFASDSFTLAINDVNDAPVLVSAIGNQDATQGVAFALDLSTFFSDPDGDTLGFSATGLPDSLGLETDGLISGTPTNADALGSPYVITVTASDGTESVGDSFELAIANVNDAPVLVSAIDNRSGMQGSALSLNVASHFSDVDGDVLAFSATGLPAGLSISADGLISGTPTVVGTSTVTVTVTDPALESASASFSLTIVAASEPEPENPPPETPQDPTEPPTGPTVVDTNTSGSSLSGDIVITEDGTVNGGTIDGVVENRGTITGDVQLGGGAQIDGGIVSGNISGDADEPALITNATVPAGTQLENVVIGAGTTLDPGVQIGANVRFESDAAIPEAIDLTGALRQLQWADKDARAVPDLNDDVVADAAMSLIRSIQLLPQFDQAGSDVSQDMGNGEIIVITNDMRANVLPVQVSQAGADDEEGVYINDDGDIVFVTANRRAVLSYPVIVQNDALVDALRSLGLELSYDSRANLQVAPATTGAQTLVERDGIIYSTSALSTNGGFYYSTRPTPQALPAYRYDEPGLYYAAAPGLPNATSIVFVFRDADGKLLEQDLVPIPGDWFALKQYLEQLPGASNVRIDAQGVISLTLQGTTVRGRVGYHVNAGDVQSGALVLKAAGDINGDGTGDYVLHYPNGEWQHLLIYP
jgi:hypothetical protein